MLHGSTVSTSSLLQGQYVNALSYNRNESINSLTSNHTPTTTFTPLVNAKTQLSNDQINPSQYTIATIQQPTTLQSNTLQYPHGLQAVLHQVYPKL